MVAAVGAEAGGAGPGVGGGVHTLVAGTDARGVRDAVVLLATPTIPPMTRPPYSNHAPDVLVTTPGARLRGAGGFAVAGAWRGYATTRKWNSTRTTTSDDDDDHNHNNHDDGDWGWDARGGYSVCD